MIGGHDCFADMHRVKSANQVRSEKRDWVGEAQRQLRMNLARDLNVNVAKNVILFIGDGMGPATVTAARFYNAQSRNLPLEDASLAWELFPDLALSMVNYVNAVPPLPPVPGLSAKVSFCLRLFNVCYSTNRKLL